MHKETLKLTHRQEKEKERKRKYRQQGMKEIKKQNTPMHNERSTSKEYIIYYKPNGGKKNQVKEKSEMMMVIMVPATTAGF